MMKSSIENPQDANQVLLDQFKIQEGDKMYIQLPAYDDFQSFDLPNEMELSAISERISAGFAPPSRLTLKHHLFNMRVPKKLFKAIRENATNDKKDEFTQERSLRRAGEILISKTPNEIADLVL